MAHFHGNATSARNSVLQNSLQPVWRLRQNEGIKIRFRNQRPRCQERDIWGVESERDMYYATKRNNTQTRVIGIAGVAIALSGAGYAIANGFGLIEAKAPVESEVVIIEEAEEVKDEPPPPPPVDVDLPPPPPQVILPDFVFDTPPPQENAVQQVISTPTPRPAPPAPPAVKPAPPAAPSIRTQPNVKTRRFKEPEYPSASRRAGEEGETRLSVCVDAEGRTSNAKVLRSSGSTRLDEAAMKSLSNNRVDPAIGSDGKPIAMCNPPWEITWVWRLENAR